MPEVWANQGLGQLRWHSNEEAGRLGGDCPGPLLLLLRLTCLGLRAVDPSDLRLEFPGCPILLANREEAPAIWGRGLMPGPPDPLKAGLWPSWPAGQAGSMGMTQPKRRLTSSAQRAGRSGGGAQRSRSRLPPSGARRPAWLWAWPPLRGPGPGCWAQAATAAGRTSCLPGGHPAPSVAALPPGSQSCSFPAGRVGGPGQLRPA